MTSVRLRELNNGFLFSCEGHAGFAEKGRDIVCAGVSALCMALVRRLEDMSLEGMVHLARCDVADGEVSLRVETEDGDKMSELMLQSAVRTVMAGFAALEEAYGEYVELT